MKWLQYFHRYRDFDEKIQALNDNAHSMEIKLNSLDTDNKNNSQTIVNLQESIYLQTEQFTQVETTYVS